MRKYHKIAFLFVFLLLPLTLVAQSAGLEVMALDALTVEGSTATLKAKVYKMGSSYTDPGVRGTKVVFRMGNKVIGTAVTDGNGLAKIKVPAGTGIRNFEVSASGVRASRGRASLYALNPNKPIIISDVDHTIAKTPKKDLTTIDNGKIKTIKGSRAMLNAMAKNYQVVYMSGRYDRTFKLTRDWIRNKGYPRGPVLLSPGLNSNHGIVKDFKSNAVGRIKKLFKKVPFGIGDRAFDMKAYSRNGVQPVLLGDNPKGKVPGGTYRLKSWAELPVNRVMRGENPFSLRARMAETLRRRARSLRELGRREGRAAGRELKRELKDAPQNLRFALMVTFMVKLAEALERGDSHAINEFFDAITDMGFYKSFGLFEAGRIGGGFIYERYLDKFVRPKVVKHVLRSHLKWAVAMALPSLVAGDFNAKTFAIDLAVFRISFDLVDKALAGAQSVLKLKRLRKVAKLGKKFSKFARLHGVAGWVFTAAKVTVIVYFADKASSWLKEKLNEYEFRKALGKKSEEMLQVLSDPKATEEEKEKALAETAQFYQSYRDYLIRDLSESNRKLREKVNELGKKIRGYELALARYEKLRKKNPEKYKSLDPIVKRLERKLKKAYEVEGEKLFADYFKKRDQIWKEAYKSETTDEAYISNDMTNYWAASGGEEHGVGDPYSGRSDIFADLGRTWTRRSFRRNLRDLPDNRLEVYRMEKELYRLALSTAKDATSRRLLTDQIGEVEKLALLDKSLYNKLIPSEVNGEEANSSMDTEGLIERVKKVIKRN